MCEHCFIERPSGFEDLFHALKVINVFLKKSLLPLPARRCHRIVGINYDVIVNATVGIQFIDDALIDALNCNGKLNASGCKGPLPGGRSGINIIDVFSIAAARFYLNVRFSGAVINERHSRRLIFAFAAIDNDKHTHEKKQGVFTHYIPSEKANHIIFPSRYNCTHDLLKESSMKAVSSMSGSIRFGCCFFFAASIAVAAQDSSGIALPKPQLDKGRPLMQVLQERKSSRVFDSRPLPRQELSNLLWAAFGVNRPESGGRTAPSAMNMQEIDLYVSLSDGLFRYDAKNHSLKKIHGKDIRDLTGKQPFVKDAAANIILTADFSRMKKADEAGKKLFAAADAAFISQNMYLYCASEGLATIVRAYIDKPALASAMQLKPEQEVIFVQTVGYPKK